MINLVLDSNQEFSVGPSDSYRFQEWGFNPAEGHEVISLIGGAVPADLTIATAIKNYIAALGNDTYVNFYIDVELHFISNSNSIEWFAASGVLPDATGDGYLLTEDNLNVDTVLSFQNLDQMPAGFHGAFIYHNVKGELANGDVVLIERIDYSIYLNRLANTAVQCRPVSLSFPHLIGNPLPPPQTLELYAGAAFMVDVSEHFSLSGGNLVLDSNVGGVKTYSGTGSQNVSMALLISIEELGENIPDCFFNYIWIRNAAGSNDNSIAIVCQYEGANYTVTPLYLEFYAIPDIVEAPFQQVTITGYGNYTATAPAWLLLTNAVGNNSRTLYVEPISSANFSPGIYTAEILIETSSGDFIVDIQHTVIGSAELGVDLNGINFTKDYDTISNFYSVDTNTIHLTLNTSFFSYKDLVSTLLQSNFKKGIYNNTSNFFLGKIIEKIMHSLLSLSSIDLDWLPDIGGGYQLADGLPGGTVYKYYNPSLTSLAYFFKDRATGQQIGDTETIYNLKFIKGRKPSRVLSTYGIVDYKESPIRVTENSVTFLNMYRSNGFNKIQILKNGVVVNTFEPDNGENQLFAMRLDFSNTTPGDVIEAQYFFSPNNAVKFQSQKYIVFDEGNYSYHIAWENEHGLLEFYEFTGAYMFTSKRDEVVAKTFTNYLEQLNKYEGDKELNFVANTGWILKSNQERIDSLLDSSRAWIVFKEDRAPISLVPRTKKQTNADSEKGEYQYEVEFTINPTHELENNTF